MMPFQPFLPALKLIKFRKHILFLFFYALGCLAPNCFADDGTGAPLNFDTQIIKIFEAAQTASAGMPEHAPSPGDRKVLARILGKFREHRMMLKNAVYRTDMGVIRITWADESNDDVVKVAYKTNKDPVLGNSLYADKRQIVDVKIMYRMAVDSYDYLHLQNMDNLLQPSGVTASTSLPPPSQPIVNYNIESKLTNEQCRFCHILAQNDGSPKGVFFPRYQNPTKNTTLKTLKTSAPCSMPIISS